MFAADVAYYRADSVQGAIQLLLQNPGARLLAGGQGLIPLMKLRLASPAALVDIGRISELHGISESGGAVRIGALTTHSQIASSDLVKDTFPVLAEVASQIADTAIRNRSTIGGNLANADPASDLPPVVMAMGGRIIATGPKGDRSIAAAGFFEGLMTTALAADEVLTAVELPTLKSGQGMSYHKLQHPASRYAVVAAGAMVTLDGGSYSKATVVVGGATATPLRVKSTESALIGKNPGEEVHKAAADLASGDLGDDVMGDAFASADYRKAMARYYVKRALNSATKSVG